MMIMMAIANFQLWKWNINCELNLCLNKRFCHCTAINSATILFSTWTIHLNFFIFNIDGRFKALGNASTGWEFWATQRRWFEKNKLIRRRTVPRKNNNHISLIVLIKKFFIRNNLAHKYEARHSVLKELQALFAYYECFDFNTSILLLFLSCSLHNNIFTCYCCCCVPLSVFFSPLPSILQPTHTFLFALASVCCFTLLHLFLPHAFFIIMWNFI
jgi:hypothetical protein